MAMSVAPAVSSPDLITIKAGVLFLKDTGHPVSRSKIQRWIADPDNPLTAERHGRTDFISLGTLLEVHRDDVLAQQSS